LLCRSAFYLDNVPVLWPVLPVLKKSIIKINVRKRRKQKHSQSLQPGVREAMLEALWSL
jgi:hypothetical protein